MWKWWMAVRRLKGPSTSLRDVLAQAIQALAGRRVRSALTIAGIGIGIAATVSTLEITATAAAAISDRFDALKATMVTVRYPDGELSPSPESLSQTAQLNGVEDAGLLCEAEGNVASSKLDSRLNQPLADRLLLTAASPAALRVLKADVATGRAFDEGHGARGDAVVVLDTVAARSFGITDLTRHPLIFVNGRPLAVLGIFEAPPGEDRLTGAIVVPYEFCERETPGMSFGPAQVVIRVKLGAADQIGDQAPIALHPAQPSALTVTVPPDLRNFREGVESETRSLFLGLAAVSLLIAAIGVSNTTLISVLERRSEIGLRRAVGASRKAIAGQFLVESALLGACGGLLGVIVGFDISALVAIYKGWTVVVDPLPIAFGPLMGVVIGTLAGIYPAWAASRVVPAISLRT